MKIEELNAWVDRIRDLPRYTVVCNPEDESAVERVAYCVSTEVIVSTSHWIEPGTVFVMRNVEG